MSLCVRGPVTEGDDSTSRSVGKGHPGNATGGMTRGRVLTKYCDSLRRNSASGTIALYRRVKTNQNNSEAESIRN